MGTKDAIARALRIASSRTNKSPTEAQKKSGRYQKGVFDWRGDLKISIENPKGSTRSGKDATGKPWACIMPSAYGEVRRTTGADGDAVDAYIGSAHQSPTVWVVDQIDAETGKFDEHKCFLDFKDKDDVVSTYTKAFSDGKGKDRIGSITEMPVDAFVAWVKHGRTKQALGDLRQKFASGGAVTDILKGVYGEGFQPEEGLDQPYHDTSELAERMQRYAAVPEWMKTVAEYDPTLGHFLQASPWGGYPEALERKDLAIGPLGTLPWLAWGAGKALLGKPAFDTAKNAAREQLWEQILSRGAPAMARAQGGRAGEADQETEAQTAEGGRAFELEYRPERPAMELAQRYYSGDLAPEPLESDFEKTLNAYEPLRNFQPMGQAELRGTGPGESRDPNSSRPKDYMAPVAELISPTLGGYGMGQMAGEVGMNLSEGEYGDAALGAAVLGVGALVPGPDGKPMRVPREIDSRGFYSPSLEAAKTIPQDVGTVQQMTAMLLKAGAKPKELEAVGYHKAFPDPNAKVSRAEIEQYLRDNRVQLEQTSGGEPKWLVRDGDDNVAKEFTSEDAAEQFRSRQADPDDFYIERPQGDNRYESYSTPGGIPGSYREVVTTLPEMKSDAWHAWQAKINELKAKYGDGFFNSGKMSPAEKASLMDLHRAAGSGSGAVYTSSHWDIPNPLLHYRVKDFYKNTDPTFSPGPPGAKVRVLDELQSDWAQRARDQGTRDPAALERLKIEGRAVEEKLSALEKEGWEYARKQPESILNPNGWPKDDWKHWANGDAAGVLSKLSERGDKEAARILADYQAARNTRMDLLNKQVAAQSGVPSAPYISNTSDWVDLGLKQALIDAAKDPSVSRLAWAPGKVQADRYNMAKAVKQLSYDPEKQVLEYLTPDGDYRILGGLTKPEALPGIVGKELAAKLLAQPLTRRPLKGAERGQFTSGHHLDLDPGTTIGGEGHKGFYGDMTPEGYQSGIVGTRLQKLVKGLDPEAARVDKAEIPTGEPRTISTIFNENWPHEQFSQNNPLFEQRFAEASAIRDAEIAKGHRSATYPSIPITPAMREKILKEGLPLFLTPLGVGVAQGLELSDDPVGDILRHHYGEESPPQFADGGSVRDITQASLTPAGLGEPRPVAEEDYTWSPLPLPPGEVSPVAQMEMARKRALSPLVSEGSWLAGYPVRVYHRLMGRNPDGSEQIDPRGIMNKATPHGADNQALMDGVAGLTPKDWKVEGRESRNVIDRRNKDPWSYD